MSRCDREGNTCGSTDSQRLTRPPYDLASGPTGSQLSVSRLSAARQMPQAQAPAGSQPPLPGACATPVEGGPPLRVTTPVPGHAWCLHRVGKRRVSESPPWCHVPAASTALSYPNPRCRGAHSPQGSRACPGCCRECWGALSSVGAWTGSLGSSRWGNWRPQAHVRAGAVSSLHVFCPIRVHGEYKVHTQK